MKYSLHNILSDIQKFERKISTESTPAVDIAFEMINFLQNVLVDLKKIVVDKGFQDENEEINFFKHTKPSILGKLIFYNKVFRIETACPVNNGKLYKNYFSNQLRELKQEYTENICHSAFYRYYRSSRSDKDHIFYKRGNIDYHDGLNSFVFEIDTSFSTYYDYKASRIIGNELLYSYLLNKISEEEETKFLFKNEDIIKDVFWTDSKNSLIELIYALYASAVISHGKVNIRKISTISQILFNIPLTDVHHAFHRMKTRSGSRTIFLDQLKINLEEYMDKDL